MRVVYDGPFDSVEVPSAGIVAERGEPVEVPDEVGRSLCEQSTWKRAPAPEKKDKGGDR